jgi:CRISPR locus-related DNA-binding protein
MVNIADVKGNADRDETKKIGRTTRSRSRYMRLDVTLMAPFYSVEPLMPAALAFQPKKLVLLVNRTNDELKGNVEKVKDMFGKLVDVKVVKMPEDDIVEFATKFVEMLDAEPKNTLVVVSVGGGWRLATNGALYGCYARPDRVYKIVGNTIKGNAISELPKMGYSIGTQKKEILKILNEEQDRTVLQIAKQLGKTRGMIYQHLRELREQGYVDDDFNITDAGKLALL